MRLDYLTIFPDYLTPLRLSLPGKAVDSGLLDLHVHDLRQWTHDRHRTVDDTPYGGGAGMVMRPEPWGEALDALGITGATLVVPTPAGRPFTQALARELATRERLVFCCGRYEGIDQRVLDHAATRAEVVEVSLGDYVLNGGEVAALAVTEAVVRLLPGFLGNAESLVEESHERGLLEYPSYTKPASWRGLEVPPVLLSGDHARIAAWRHEQAVRRTVERRPDLLPPTVLDDGTPITRATPADAGELLVLQLACSVHEVTAGGALDYPPLREDLDAVIHRIATWDVAVVRRGGRLVGSVSGRLTADRDVWEISRLVTAPDLQSDEIERVLLDHVQDVAPESVTSYSLTTGERSERTLRICRKAGFRVRRDLPAPPGTVVLTRPRRLRDR